MESKQRQHFLILQLDLRITVFSAVTKRSVHFFNIFIGIKLRRTRGEVKVYLGGWANGAASTSGRVQRAVKLIF
jgi:hypothetical protein